MEKRRAVSLFIMTAAFIAVYFLKVNVVIVILICGLIGFITTVAGKKRD